MIYKSSKCKKGLTLLEVVISISILMIILTPVCSMVYSNVKTNKYGENAQKSQMLIQKYTEDVKANTLSNLGEHVYNDEGFQVNVNVTQISQYNFPSLNNTSGSAINTITYDMKIIMDSQNINVYDKSDSKIQSISAEGNKVLTVIDKSDTLGVFEGFNSDDSLDIGSNQNPIIKSSTQASKIKVQISSNYTLSIHAKAYCDSGDLSFYCSRNNNNSGQIYVINNIGSVKTLYNTPIQDESSNGSSGRVYRINISIYKDNNLINSSSAYKAALD